MDEKQESSEKTVVYFLCELCNEKFIDGDDEKFITPDNMIVCTSCYDDNYSSCEECGDVVNNNDITHTGESTFVCQKCIDDHYVKCDDCNEFFKDNHIHSDEYHNICNSCFDANYTYCENCGDIIHCDDIYGDDGSSAYCEACWDSMDHDDDDDDGSSHGGFLHQYGYRPKLIFHSVDNEVCDLHFGVETEIDKGEHENFRFSSLNPNHVWCDYDGSLSSEGIEIISHPMTYNYIMEKRPFKDVYDIAIKSGYKAHNTTTCGTHIHMSRKAFNYDDERLTSFIFLFEKFWKNVVIFSRRKHNFNVCDTSINAIDHYAARYCDLIDEKENKITRKTVDEKKNQKGFNRYHCVNITNGATIEVRIFKGTLKESTLIASIQLCKIFFDLSIYDGTTIDKLTWYDVKQYAKDIGYSEFTSYCNERGV